MPIACSLVAWMIFVAVDTTVSNAVTSISLFGLQGNIYNRDTARLAMSV